MAKPIFKSRLLIGIKLLGSLFYDRDAEDRGYLKLSFKNKITGLGIGVDVPTRMPVPVASPLPSRLEVSYKFADNLFGVKTYTGGKWSR